MKDVIGTEFRSFGKTGAETSEPETKAFLNFFNFFEITKTGKAMFTKINFLRSFCGKNFSSIGVPSEKLCPFQ
jgi:hypothetical protein